MDRRRSICEYFYEPNGVEGHRCGYCESSDTSVSNGMWTHYLTCEDYLDLLDRGWRRSGKYCYKPIMNRTCCPLYTIRCDVREFRLSKSQKKALKKLREFVTSGKNKSDHEPHSSTMKPPGDSGEGGAGKSGDHTESVKAPSKSVRPGTGPDPSKPPCRKAKEIRRERKEHKLSTRPGEAAATSGPSAATQHSTPSFFDTGLDGKKPLEEFLVLPSPAAHQLEVKFVRSSPPSQEFNDTFQESFSLYQKYQMAVHGDTFEDCNKKQFIRFLCDSPLIPEDGPKAWPCGYGSYHQHYRLDGRLVMVGVVDILPHCLSSVYVFYDPDIKFLSPGVYSALQEIGATRNLYRHCPAFHYYYMGYYVHTCQKMKYKGQYNPSFLLCPESYRFVPIAPCLPKLDANRYSRLLIEDTAAERVDSWLEDALILHKRQAMMYAVYKALYGSQDEDKVREYASLVGPSVSRRMLLFLS